MRRSGTPGTDTSRPEVTNVSRHGLWLLIDGRELFLAFEEYPWFKGASVEAVFAVERPHPHHLRWPQLDIDLTLNSIEDPDQYPLKAKA